ncbi:MAG: thrombospondin type 3 repeat-containing protein [Acidobacteriota bacterium]
MLSLRLRRAALMTATLVGLLACLACGNGSDGTSPTTAADRDRDGVPDGVDNCPDTVNAAQFDTDGDGLGNSCDNCPWARNADQTDIDVNGVGDICEGDADADGIPDAADNCDFVANVDQANGDGDTRGDACDPDIDNDGIANEEDPDQDGDGIANAADGNSTNRFECGDTDADTCDDCTSGTSDPSADGVDSDGDGFCDAGLRQVKATVMVESDDPVYGVQFTLNHGDLDITSAVSALGPYDPANYGGVPPRILFVSNISIPGEVTVLATFEQLVPDPSFAAPAAVAEYILTFSSPVPAIGDFSFDECLLSDSAAMEMTGTCEIELELDPVLP